MRAPTSVVFVRGEKVGIENRISYLRFFFLLSNSTDNKHVCVKNDVPLGTEYLLCARASYDSLGTLPGRKKCPHSTCVAKGNALSLELEIKYRLIQNVGFFNTKSPSEKDHANFLIGLNLLNVLIFKITFPDDNAIQWVDSEDRANCKIFR